MAILDRLPAIIARHGDRWFIDIATRGCGSGCAYCYIDGPSGDQALVDLDVLRESVDRLIRHSDFKPGVDGSMVSLSPNSEPLKPLAAQHTYAILKAVLPLGNSVQIPTKEMINSDLLQIIDAFAKDDRQTCLFVSVSSLRIAAKIEPGAATVRERFANFYLARNHRLKTCLYIKPFLPKTATELPLFVDAMSQALPNSVCVGIRYEEQKQRAAGAFTHPVKSNWRSDGISAKMQDFRTVLSNRIGIPIFYNSTCVSAYFYDREPPRKVWFDSPAQCVRCRGCGTS